MPTTSPGIETTRVHDPRPGSRAMTAEVLWSLPRVGGPEPSPDGRFAVVPVTTYPEDDGDPSTRLWLIEVETGDARPITKEEFQSSQPAFSPEGQRVAFIRKAPKGDDDAHAPMPQVMVLPLDGGEAEAVTDMPLGCFDPTWLPDGSGLVFGAWLYRDHLTPEASREAYKAAEHPQTVHRTEERFYRYWDHWLTDGKTAHFFHLDLETGALTDLMPDSTLFFETMELSGLYDIAPDGGAIVFSAGELKDNTTGYVWNVYRVGIGGGEVECLTTGNPAHSNHPRYSPDGAGIVYGKTEDLHFYADRPRLMWLDVESGQHIPVLTEWDRIPAGWTFAESGDLYFHAEDDGYRKLYVVPESDLHPDPDEATPTEVTHDCATGGVKPLPDGSLLFLKNSISDAPEVWRSGPRGGDAERLTWFTDEGMTDVALGEVKDLRFTGADDHRIQMFVIFPPDAKEGVKLPLMHIVHGGPHGMMGDFWLWRWHAHTFAARGYVVALTNFHGSTGWGTDFAKCIRGALGDKPYTDAMAGTDALIELGIVDSDRMAIAGASYGGYLTSWITTQTNRFRCAINHAGVFDHKMMYASDYTYGMGDAQGAWPWEDQAEVDRYDPARHTEGLQTPTLVTHGALDYRVPLDNALEVYGILKAKGVPARLVYYTNENHWVLKRGNSLIWYGEVLDWLDRWL